MLSPDAFCCTYADDPGGLFKFGVDSNKRKTDTPSSAAGVHRLDSLRSARPNMNSFFMPMSLNGSQNAFFVVARTREA